MTNNPEGMTKDRKVPRHWDQNSWEDKARENPLYAVMTTPEMQDAPSRDFDIKRLEVFWAKGESLFANHIQPRIEELNKAKDDLSIVEYGCGAGRILKALTRRGYACAGIDIAPTMIEHCRRLVPEVRSLHVLDENGRSDLADAVADLVYSYAVVQHIGTLTAYRAAFAEMGRLVKPGGMLAVQLNTFDFETGSLDSPGRTENFEEHCLFYGPGSSVPTRRHDHSNWSGVHIGIHLLKDMLSAQKISWQRFYFHTPKKLKAVWLVATKDKPGTGEGLPCSD